MRAGIVPQLLMTVIRAILAHIFTIGTSGQKLQANENRFAETIEMNDSTKIKEMRALLAITPLPAFLLVNCIIPNES